MRSKRMMLAVLLTSFGLVSFGACGPESHPDEPDAKEPCEASQTFCGTDIAGEAICADLQSDALNCGVCGYECRLPATNACIGGLCTCMGDGNVSDACDDPTQCAPQSGQCLVPDSTGPVCDPVESTPCEDPHRLCVGGFCTLPDCDHEEACDGRDNDCDGHVDGTGPHPGQTTPLERDCYEGNPAQDGVGLCRHGEETCRFGAWSACEGQTFPVPEVDVLTCDGVDNDCNGCIDDHFDDHGQLECGPLEPKKFDIVFILDRSASMQDTINDVVAAVQSWATNIGTNPNIRFGLIDPTAWPDLDADGVSVTLPLSSLAVFHAVMTGVVDNGNSIERMHYATQLVLNGSFDTALHTDPAATRVVIAIHDESATKDENVVPGYNEASVCAALAPNEMLAVITYPQWYEEWDACASSTSMPPMAMPLTPSTAMMLANLDQIIETALCQ